MSNFIKLTRRGYRRVTLKNLRRIWISVDHIITIRENTHGGSVIVCRLGDFTERVVYVTSSPDEILQLMQKTAEQ